MEGPSSSAPPSIAVKPPLVITELVSVAAPAVFCTTKAESAAIPLNQVDFLTTPGVAVDPWLVWFQVSNSSGINGRSRSCGAPVDITLPMIVFSYDTAIIHPPMLQMKLKQGQQSTYHLRYGSHTRTYNLQFVFDSEDHLHSPVACR